MVSNTNYLLMVMTLSNFLQGHLRRDNIVNLSNEIGSLLYIVYCIVKMFKGTAIFPSRKKDSVENWLHRARRGQMIKAEAFAPLSLPTKMKKKFWQIIHDSVCLMWWKDCQEWSFRCLLTILKATLLFLS